MLNIENLEFSADVAGAITETRSGNNAGTIVYTSVVKIVVQITEIMK